ncbi:MAG: hypothetical protein JXB88_26065 [Spirochaetales bacterium]|nr:hypothetical protein [Spirochaetales bacterium]
MILRIDSAAGQVKIGNPPIVLPGILSSISINGELLIDNVSVEGKSGSSKQVHGWNDATLNISLLLIDNEKAKKTRFNYLADIVGHFKKIKDGMPVVYNLQHPMAKAWNIKQLLFSSLQTTEEYNRITITLEFVEHEPVVGITQERHDSVMTKQTATDANYQGSVNGTIKPQQLNTTKELELKYCEF